MVKFYIAYSIPGTNAFITATKEDQTVTVMPPDEVLHKDDALYSVGNLHHFKVVKSRRPDYNREKDGYKLHWMHLTKPTGEAITDPQHVLEVFSILSDDGWVVNSTKFMEKHYEGKVDTTVSG